MGMQMGVGGGKGESGWEKLGAESEGRYVLHG